VAPGGAPSRPQEHFATAWFIPNIEREGSEDGWAARRQDPVLKVQVGDGRPVAVQGRIARNT